MPSFFNVKLLFALILTSIFTANAQKIPGKQEASLRLPANVKIDGKAAEWNNKFQAYNGATEIFYTMANDAENLYLIVSANKSDIITKLLSGSITLTVNNAGKKSEDNSQTFTFPLLNWKPATALRANLKNKTSNVDSLILAANQALSEGAKEIKIDGFTNIIDTITETHTTKKDYFRSLALFNLPGYYLPISNSYGIKAAAYFESKWIYTHELLIPLKYLNLTSTGKFSYNIRLNGAMYKTNKPAAGFMIIRRYVNGVGYNENEDMLSPTDFWAEYTLAK